MIKPIQNNVIAPIQEMELCDNYHNILHSADTTYKKIFIKEVTAFAIGLLPFDTSIRINAHEYTPYMDFEESMIMQIYSYQQNMDLEEAYPMPVEQLKTVGELIHYMRDVNKLNYRYLTIEAFCENIVEFHYYLGTAIFTFKESCDYQKTLTALNKHLKNKR